MLLDEPLAALDIGLKERILPYLGRVRDEFEIPMIYVTHNLTEVLSLADWVLMIQQGKLDHPRYSERDAYARLTRCFSSRRSVRKCLHGKLSLIQTAKPVDSKVRLHRAKNLLIPYLHVRRIRPFQIRISADDIIVATQNPEGISAGNVLPGTIRTIDLLDGQAMLTVFAGEDFYVRLTAAAVSQAWLARR